ncbi:MAG: sporulation protein YqfD [Eubacteriales bacterium]|nr:sporulation protein YqfD [Eubacteriales bacterium]MDD4512839.1 sporulation protein YqfD [Eubacteriales bacterium]
MDKPLFLRIAVEGLYIEKLILAMRERGAVIGEVSLPKRHTAVVAVRESAKELFLQAARESGYKAEIVSESPVRRALIFLSRWRFLLIGLFVAAALSGVFCSRCWFVSVSGAGAYSPAVLEALEEYGFSSGCAKSAVSPNDIREKLILRFPKIAWIETRVNGLWLEVKLTRGVEAPPVSDICGWHDIVASESGVLLSLVVTAGTPLKEAGDVVVKGETLVLGQERNSGGKTVPVKAAASAAARVWAEKSIVVPNFDILSEGTGNETEITEISLFGFPVLAFGEESGFAEFDIVRSEIEVGGAFLPLVVSRETRREVVTKKAPADMEKRLAEAEQTLFSLMCDEGLANGEIVDKWAVYSIIDDENTLVSMTLELRKDIAAERSGTD